PVLSPGSELLRSFPQRFQRVSIEAAAWKFLAVAQGDHELSVVARLQFFDLADIHYQRPVDTNELGGIKLVRHASDRFAKQVRILPGNVQTNVIRGCLDPVDLIELNENHSAAGLDDQPIFGMRLSCGMKQVGEIVIERAFGRFHDFRLGAFQRSMQTILIKWLQQIIKRLRLEGLKGIAVVRSGKDHDRHLARNAANDVEAIAAFQLDVEQEQIWTMAAHGVQGVFHAGAFGNDLYVWFVIQQKAQLFAR